ncbi:PREDICTED: uncharacterized protein C7orf50 [Vollenhovia emeryi]|uniref:uncharacterized protein C7orf50 n=1 Tax=Vollenhovia emeryi TaxID=411798 RepID=UPI0005F43D14|nr:PREDICTED: uncharacterized protein C7orf50 [Vollenhovia emeryi]
MNNDDKLQKRKKRKRNDEREKAEASTNNQQTVISQEKTPERKRARVNDSRETATTNTDVSTDSSQNAKQPSKRQLKKQKIALQELKSAEMRKERVLQQAHNYILMWKHSRKEWKFEKLKQIWLMDNMMKKHAVSDAMFPTVLEYFEECKGRARKVLIQKAMDIIKKVDEETNEECKRAIMDTVDYIRARELLQTLTPDEKF